jgi:PDZ domain-containing protein
MLGLLPDTDAVPSSSLIPSGMTGREYLVYSRLLMGESVGLASVVAVRAAGGVSAADGSGVRVFAPMPGAGVSGLLPGDLLLSVGGVDLRLAGDVAPAVRGLAPGSSVPATVLRDGVSREILITLGPCVPDAEEMKLGAMLATENPVFHTHPEVSVDTGGIAGPSGGLALALAIYSKLTEEDLLRGRVVAATGQIREDGSVAPVGGIAQKARAAIEGRAEVFLVPAADAAAARAAAPSLLVIGVSDFSEAVSYLRE